MNVCNSALGIRQVSLCGQQWCFTVSQPVCFAVKGVGGGSWCEALLEGSQAPRILSFDFFFFSLAFWGLFCFEPGVRSVQFTALLHWHYLKSKLMLKFLQHLL